MIVKAIGTVATALDCSADHQSIETEHGPAIVYTRLTDPVAVGDRVLLNRTANVLHLGTGGFDFVIANLTSPVSEAGMPPGHIIKMRYTPCQTAVATLEEDPVLEPIWERTLELAPVIVCQLHSQIAHAAAAAAARGKVAVYVMTDTGSLMAVLSDLLRDLLRSKILAACITAGQACGGTYETLTVHSALLAAKHYLGADLIIVGQGPGNAGTGTKYGFGGIDQAGLLDIAAAMGGLPIAMVRASGADDRERHRGVSHHTITTLRLVRSVCTIPVPEGIITDDMDSRHTFVSVRPAEDGFQLLKNAGITVSSMGRTVEDDLLYFQAAAAAGQFASEIGNV